MKFHRITLRDYRGIRYCEIEPREDGVTVIEGDNEVGKSSIAEALWLIFEQHDDSSSQLVKSLRPADRDAATEIEVDVSTGPYRFLYFKRFHRGPRTELKIIAPRREILAGREADNRANAILRETIDVSLWKALRSQQGMQDSLEPPAAGQHRSLLGALETAAGPLMGGEREQAVFAAAQAEYEKYFTPSGRERASGEGPSLPRLRTAEVEAMAEVDRISARIAELELKAQRSAELATLLADTRRQLAQAIESRDAFAARDRERQDVARTVERLRAELQAREAEARGFLRDQEFREHTLDAVAPRRQALAEAEALVAQVGPELDQQRTALKEAESAAERAGLARDDAARALARAEDLVQLSGRQLQADQMSERLARLEQLGPEVAQLEAWLAACRVDNRVVADLERLDRELVALEARRDAEAAAVEITAATATSIRIGDKEVALAEGQTRRGNVRGETVMELPGGITLLIRAGSAARESEARLREAQEALAARLQAAGAASLAEARDILSERAKAEERQKQFAAQMTNDLRDLGSSRELAEKLERERSGIAAVLLESGLESAPRIEEAKVQREAAAAALAERERELRAADAAHREAAEQLARMEAESGARSAGAAALRAEVERAEQELARIREQQSDEALSESIAASVATRAEAEAALAQALEALASLPDVTEELRAASADADSLARTLTEADREEAGIRALLEDAGASGLHGKLVEAEQRLVAASDELAAFSRRASAARLLFETLRAHRDQARENYAGPLKECIEALGRRIYNDSFAIELSEDLRIVRRSLDGITLDLAQISIGAREQLSVLTRLACAALVSKDGGAPLVLDDILGWADPKRLDALGPVLAEAAGGSQVLLFTCSPDRFASVRPARVISLPSGQTVERSFDASPQPASGPPAPAPARVRAAAAVGAAGAPRPPQGTLDLFDASPGSRVN